MDFPFLFDVGADDFVEQVFDLRVGDVDVTKGDMEGSIWVCLRPPKKTRFGFSSNEFHLFDSNGVFGAWDGDIVKFATGWYVVFG